MPPGWEAWSGFPEVGRRWSGFPWGGVSRKGGRPWLSAPDCLSAPATPPQRYASDDQTSILVCTRASTSEVNSVVLEWPPRSGVLMPEATVSRALS